eukprot:14696225-Alexandrium_andersonii.AAC.1
MARRAQQPPPKVLTELEPLFVVWLPEEAPVQRLSVLADYAVSEHITGVLSQPSQDWLVARRTA